MLISFKILIRPDGRSDNFGDAMARERTTLAHIGIGETVRITAVGGEGALRQHFLDMGVIPEAEISLVKFAPMGDPMEFLIHGYELTLRVADADKISVEPIGVRAEQETAAPHTPTEHPGLGEGGRYHVKATENPLPEGTTLTFALVGNQNSGKTTLYNQLTGSNQRVGNFPGVTVDRKDGVIRGHADTNVTDLPGIYSMSPYSEEEVVSRRFILDEKPCGIIDIVDATNIGRNLYLTMQLMELDRPMVLALNMMDEVQGNGGSIRVNEMEGMLGIPVVAISAAKNQGVDELIDHALHVAMYQERPGRQDFCDKDDHGGAVHRALHGIMHLIEDHAVKADIPVRFAATKVIEGDGRVISALELQPNELVAIERVISQMEEERGLDRAAAIADMRYSFIDKVVAACVVKPRENRERARSRIIDRVLTGTWTAFPAFFAIMALIFWLTFDVIGVRLQNLMQAGVDSLTALADGALAAVGTNDVIRSLVVDGIIGGVGAVLVFLPVIVTLFFLLSLLEDTGYMARIAFVMDKLLRRIGLSGRSIVPMLMGFGCTVPAIMAARTLPSERDRKLTILMLPFMSCSTKLTIYGFFTAAFFPGHGAVVMIGLYLLGILTGIITALIGCRTLFRGEAAPFVMELPNYRMPSPKSVGRLVWLKSKDFVMRASSVVFIASIIVWFLQSFGPNLALVSDPSQSILALVSGAISPIFAPLGFDDWRITVALVAGFMAKEVVVSTLLVLVGSASALATLLAPSSALALCVFCLLYTPCVAAIACVRRELGSRWAGGIVVFQCVVAWVVAFIVRLIALGVGVG